ncbi:MAG: GNAT family N-acetyltransferase [Oscillospiraceae bacterium]|nr:GNAT family N-acetyltransferase [Oscillospiraceae bacterium]
MERTIRTAVPADLDGLATVEETCFPPEKAASRETLQRRLERYSGHFLLLLEEERLIGFINGFVTDSPDLTDDMYTHAELHNENGAWQMIFGLNTLPEYRRQGCAAQLLRRMIEDAAAQGREGLVLTCRDELIHYYAKFGFMNEGVTAKSTHGGVRWNQMRLRFGDILHQER